jgi:PAS domain S-box-containing protein
MTLADGGQLTEGRRVPASEALLAAIVASNEDAILSKDIDGIVTSWNAGAERLYGYSAAEMIGRSVGVLIPEERQGEEWKILQTVLRGEMVDHYETDRLRKDGAVIRVSLTVSPVCDPEGVVVGASTIARDVTERHRATLMFQGLLDSAPDAMVIAGSDGTIVIVNRQVEQVFGYCRDELIGHPVEMLVPERLRARHLEHRTQFFSSPQVRPMGVGLELLGVRSDGTEFPIEVSLSPFQSDGGTGLVSAAIRDITERKRAEAELERAHRALVQSERLSAVGEMATVIGHELRNPLGAATNALFLIRQRLGAIDDPQLERHLSMVERETSRAAALSEDLTAYMRERAPVPTAFRVRPVVEAVLESTPPPPGVDVLVQADDIDAWADRDQFVQILTNVLTNAYQAMPGGGPVTVRVSEDDGWLTLVVRDSGTGIAPGTGDRLFEPFFTTKPSGTGLGLVIVRRLAEAHGGTAEIADGPDGGAVVTIRLPLRAEGA